MLVPLYSFVLGDCLGLVVLIEDRQTIAQLAATAMRAATTRVVPAERAAVYRHGQRLDPRLTVAEAGLAALDRIDVVPEDEHG